MPGLPPVRAILEESLRNEGDRPHYVRGCWDSRSGKFRPAGLQQSHALYGMSRADCLVRVGAWESLEKGAETTGYVMSWG